MSDETSRPLSDSEQLETDEELLALEQEQGADGELRGWRRLFIGSEMSPAERLAALEQLFFEGAEWRPHLVRIATLMALSTTIATLGLLADSAAVVIGAMLVAPLMTPILAVAASSVMVWPRRQLRALAVVAVASAGAIGLAALISALVSARDPLLSGEVLGRTQPTTLDLGVALAAGAAGAYVTVRRKAGGALPGVAIAVALVPPLSVVGILVERGETDLALNALLLFVTNLVGIILMASLVFLATGFIPRARSLSQSREIQIGLVVSALLVAAVAYPLAAQGQRIISDLNDERTLESNVQDVLRAQGSRAELLDTTIDREADPTVVTLAMAVPDEEQFSQREISAAADLIASGFGTDVELRVHYTRAVIGDGRPPEEEE